MEFVPRGISQITHRRKWEMSMFGGKKKRQEQLLRLEQAMDQAAAVMKVTDPAVLEPVLRELSKALFDMPHNDSTDLESYDPDLDGVRDRSWKIREQLTKALNAAQDQHMPACWRCGGLELLVSHKARIESLYASDGARIDLRFTVSVCRTCGDVRLTTSNLEALEESIGRGALRAATAKQADKTPYR